MHAFANGQVWQNPHRSSTVRRRANSGAWCQIASSDGQPLNWPLQVRNGGVGVGEGLRLCG